MAIGNLFISSATNVRKADPADSMTEHRALALEPEELGLVALWRLTAPPSKPFSTQRLTFPMASLSPYYCNFLKKYYGKIIQLLIIITLKNPLFLLLISILILQDKKN